MQARRSLAFSFKNTLRNKTTCKPDMLLGSQSKLELLSRQPSGSRTLAKQTSQSKPWHELPPHQLAVVTTLGNLASLSAAASQDHAVVRLLSGVSSLVSVGYNSFMPKPLKTHQLTAVAWSCAFAMLHFVNFGLLLWESSHAIKLSDEEEDIYEHGFQVHRVTPRQFRKLLDSGAKFRDYQPGALITEYGKPVSRVIYVTHGTCIGERVGGCPVLEYHQDVFIGHLQPKIWRAEYLGSGDVANIEDLDSDAEEDWLIEKCARRKRRSPKDLRSLLEAGLAERTGPITKVQSGASWNGTTRAGPDGCRVIEWPLGSFACRVGSDESLCKAMENMCTLSLAAKISQGARGKALEGYSELLSLVVRDGIVDPEERQALSHYRARHAVPDTEHWRMLDELGWTLEEFDQGVLKSHHQKLCTSRQASFWHWLLP
ncbi:Blood vessel epicardial substance [Durusdinium trenchii]|uniref:Blood vessel epicardial substance n=1 Tax=Durusdinium trenchii TaxID=1381693 RepID=A0ABP0RPP6_9DINO